MNRSSKTVPIFLLVGVIAAAILRFFQYVSIIDYKTGFFVSGGEAAGALIYILLGILSAVLIVLLIIGKKRGEAAYTVASDGMGSHATQALGASELAAACLFGLHAINSGTVLTTICAGAIAIFLVASGFIQLKNIVPPAITGHLKIVCAILLFPILAEFYESDLIMHRRSDKLIVIIGYIFIGAFFASISRFYSRLETPNSRMRELITSGMTFIITSAHTLPKMLAYAFGGTVVSGMSGIDLIITAAMLMSYTFICTLFFTTKSKDIIPVVYEDEEKKEEEDDASLE